MIRSNKNTDGHYHGKGRRRTDYSNHNDYAKNHPHLVTHRPHRKKIKTPSLEHIAEWIFIGLSLGTFTYLSVKGYTPKLGTAHVEEINKRYALQKNPLKGIVDSIENKISTTSIESLYSSENK